MNEFKIPLGAVVAQVALPQAPSTFPLKAIAVARTATQ